MIYIYGFYILCGLCLLIYFYTRAKLASPDDLNFKSFQRTYLSVYVLAMGKLSIYR